MTLDLLKNTTVLCVKVMISSKDLDSTLSKAYWKAEWWLLAPWSSLKHPKKWMRNKRLQKKFRKKRRIYLPFWIFQRFEELTDDQLDESYKKLQNEKHLIRDHLRRKDI
jgi:hypothetical protein